MTYSYGPAIELTKNLGGGRISLCKCYGVGCFKNREFYSLFVLRVQKMA